MLCQAWLLKKGLVLTIKDANGIATQYRAHPAMPVQQLLHELSVLPASPFVDGDELRVISSPTQSRPLNNMEETLWATDAHGLSVGISHFVSSNLPTQVSSWILPFLPCPELSLYVRKCDGHFAGGAAGGGRASSSLSIGDRIPAQTDRHRHLHFCRCPVSAKECTEIKMTPALALAPKYRIHHM